MNTIYFKSVPLAEKQLSEQILQILRLETQIEMTFRTCEKQRKDAIEFIKSIADLLNMDPDGLGYDGLSLSLDDFRNAIKAIKDKA